jgi:hypothetical protein
MLTSVSPAASPVIAIGASRPAGKLVGNAARLLPLTSACALKTGVVTNCTYGSLSAPAAFVAVTVKLKLPGAVGVPAKAPVFASSVMPGGRLPAVTLQVIGVEPLAVNVAVLGAPPTIFASGDAGAVIDGGCRMVCE